MRVTASFLSPMQRRPTRGQRPRSRHRVVPAAEARARAAQVRRVRRARGPGACPAHLGVREGVQHLEAEAQVAADDVGGALLGQREPAGRWVRGRAGERVGGRHGRGGPRAPRHRACERRAASDPGPAGAAPRAGGPGPAVAARAPVGAPRGGVLGYLQSLAKRHDDLRWAHRGAGPQARAVGPKAGCRSNAPGPPGAAPEARVLVPLGRPPRVPSPTPGPLPGVPRTPTRDAPEAGKLPRPHLAQELHAQGVLVEQLHQQRLALVQALHGEDQPGAAPRVGGGPAGGRRGGARLRRRCGLELRGSARAPPAALRLRASRGRRCPPNHARARRRAHRCCHMGWRLR
jgi:hypothetical protein